MQEIRNLNCSSTVAGGILVFLLAILNRVEVEKEERRSCGLVRGEARLCFG